MKSIRVKPVATARYDWPCTAGDSRTSIVMGILSDLEKTTIEDVLEVFYSHMEITLYVLIFAVGHWL